MEIEQIRSPMYKVTCTRCREVRVVEGHLNSFFSFILNVTEQSPYVVEQYGLCISCGDSFREWIRKYA